MTDETAEQREERARVWRELYTRVRPPLGFKRGFVQLVVWGCCPWCGQPVSNVTASLDPGRGLTWACREGCNP